MAEEFQESDIIFSEINDEDVEGGLFYKYPELMVVNSNNSSNHHEHQHHARRVTSTHHQTSKKKKKKKTVPINIPDDVFQCGAGFVMEEDYDFEGEMIPPHVMLGRRIAGKMEFSVCTGNGRTLKGRDLSQVRNSILRMTGFLET